MIHIAVTRLTTLLVAMIVALSGAVLFAGAATAATGSALYQVTISGTVSGNRFVRTGYLLVASTVTRVTRNGVNQYEMCLQSGWPASAPSTGAIKFGTNSACFGSRSAVDLAVTGWSGNNYLVRPAANLAYTGVNGWNARSGLFAYIYYPIGGQAAFRFNRNGTMAGSLQLQGFGGGGFGSSTYLAVLSGRLIR